MMNFKKIILLLIGLSVGFTTESFAGRSKKTLGNEDAQIGRSVRKARPIKARPIQRKNIEGINKRTARSSILRKKRQGTVSQSRNVKNTRVPRNRAASRRSTPAVGAPIKNKVAARKKTVVKRPAPAVSRQEAEKPTTPIVSFVVPEQNGQWQAAYELNDGTIAKRTLNGVQYGSFSAGKGIHLGRGMMINGKRFENDLDLSMDQNQTDFLKALGKVGGVKKVTSLQ